ncbi:leucine-responsive regulatory protein [Vibrio variabilis]|uniref:Leucine-responsive regulatory protein n=1 Tax=Vibrio variabilis TaxID=990271 RepID=A0ABQ0JKC1_9VIBR|nr:leucine-responsive regulatory protein [Vibrio variabilis]
MADNYKKPSKELDRIDRNILNELQKMVVFQTSNSRNA